MVPVKHNKDIGERNFWVGGECWGNHQKCSGKWIFCIIFSTMFDLL